jgi:hypothetical protein
MTSWTVVGSVVMKSWHWRLSSLNPWHNICHLFSVFSVWFICLQSSVSFLHLYLWLCCSLLITVNPSHIDCAHHYFLSLWLSILWKIQRNVYLHSGAVLLKKDTACRKDLRNVSPVRLKRTRGTNCTTTEVAKIESCVRKIFKIPSD